MPKCHRSSHRRRQSHHSPECPSPRALLRHTPHGSRNRRRGKELLDVLREEHQPFGAGKEILVYKMAEHFLFQKRASYLLTEQVLFADHGSYIAGKISLFMRYALPHHLRPRLQRALTELRKLQKERQLEEIGFVSQNAETARIGRNWVCFAKIP
jgi:hypothetical protein